MELTLETVWLLVCTMLVFSMQAGFCCLESGLCRSKNNINVAFKNVIDFCVGSSIFWLFGFALMFGTSWGGWIGSSGFLFSDAPGDGRSSSFFVFQLVFCGTAVTLASGAVAERMGIHAYLILAVVISSLVYPLFGHWVWGGIFTGETTGWLAKLGFIDFAGSTVVHSVGAWSALAAVVLIGPRIGRFRQGQSPYKFRGSSLPLSTLGLFILWFGWLGFNAGSGFALGANIPVIMANTFLAGAFGALGVLSWQLFTAKHISAELLINGVLAGLVSVTANCNIVSHGAAATIGMIGALVMLFGVWLLERVMRIDDVVGAISVHGFAGVWGTLAVAFFAPTSFLQGGYSRWQLVSVQLLGVAVCFVWSFGVTYVLLKLASCVIRLRVTEEEEQQGLNMAEHGASTELHDLLVTMEVHRQGDLSARALADEFSDMGLIAQQFNRVVTARCDAENRLEEEMAERERSTEIMREKDNQIQQKGKLESIGSLAGGIAHEFNNLLQVIRGYTKFAMDELDDSQQPYQDLQQSIDAADRAATLTSQLLGYSRKQILTREALNPNQTVLDLVKMIRPVIGERVDLQVDLDDNVGAISADPAMLQQMLMNLCINARDAMSDGGQIRITTTNLHLSNKYCDMHGDVKPGRYVKISVIDAGTGMSPEVARRIFEPFYSTKDVGKGTGLGLAFVFGVVQQHNGTIEVYSEENIGTTFKLYLPTSDECADETEYEPATVGGNEMILFADDDPQVREIGIRILKEAGYQVLVATDGEEAIRLYRENHSDVSLVLSDIIMPKYDGHQVYEQIKLIDPDVRVVFCSGYDPNTTRSRNLCDEGVPLVEKPFDPYDLLGTVRKVIDRQMCNIPELVP